MNQELPPLVSVIIPTYNRPSYLKQTLESVYNQTYKNIEIIVIDDGSPNDEAFEVCKNYIAVTYIKIENSGGPAKPRNIGIKSSKGKYIAILDDDDLWVEDKIEKQVKILEEHPDFGLVHGYCQIIDKDGLLINSFIGKPGTPDVKHGDVSLKMIGNWTLMTSSVLLKKEIIDLVGLFNEKMPPAGEDLEFWVRCSFLTKFFFINKPIVHYRTHLNNISENKVKYLLLPLYLKNVLQEQQIKQRISNKQYKFLLNSLCKMQIKMVRVSYFKTIGKLFLLDPLWLIKKNNLKMLIYILFFKK